MITGLRSVCIAWTVYVATCATFECLNSMRSLASCMEMSMTKKSQWLGLVGWLVLCYLVAALGAAASIQAASFYAGLQRPGWAPPGWLFGPV